LPATELPRIDEHRIVINAGVADVWRVLIDTLDRSFSRNATAGFARVVGCADRTASGPRPLAAGSTIPGFHVTDSKPESELVLEGRHHFSTYSLTFRLESAGPGRTRLSAESRADFPGPAGRVYRLLVIGTRGHVFAVRRLLSGIKRRSEPRAATPA
jgi:hypothetical protein